MDNFALVYVKNVASASGYKYLLKVDAARAMSVKEFGLLVGPSIKTFYEKKKQSTIERIGNIVFIIAVVVVAVMTGQYYLLNIALAITMTAIAIALTIAATVMALGAFMAARWGMDTAAIMLGKVAQWTGMAAQIVGIMALTLNIESFINQIAEQGIQQATANALLEKGMELTLDNMIDMAINKISNISLSQVMSGVTFIGEKVISAQVADKQDDIKHLQDVVSEQEKELEELQGDDKDPLMSLTNPSTFGLVLVEQGLSTEFIGPFQPLEQIELDLIYPTQYKIPMSTLVNGG